MNKNFPYKRILLKLSGEAFGSQENHSIHKDAVIETANALRDIQLCNIELGVVIGGGNIFRGSSLLDLEIKRTPADQIGMLATIMNGIVLHEILKKMGCVVRLFSAVPCPLVAETYNWKKAKEALDHGEIVLFVGGTGNPYFTTDSAAALRASEIDADILLKATKVNGIYSKDPLLHPDAIKYEHITYSEAIEKQLKVMDNTAFALCKNASIPIFVFNMEKLSELSIFEILSNKHYGTLVT